jgi:hypothetical protein
MPPIYSTQQDSSRPTAHVHRQSSRRFVSMTRSSTSILEFTKTYKIWQEWQRTQAGEAKRPVKSSAAPAAGAQLGSCKRSSPATSPTGCEKLIRSITGSSENDGRKPQNRYSGGVGAGPSGTAGT